MILALLLTLAHADQPNTRELIKIAKADPDAFDLQNLRETGVVKYMCADRGYSVELDRACDRVMLKLAKGVK